MIAIQGPVNFQPLRQASTYAAELAHWLHEERRRFGAAGTKAEGLAKLQAECSNSATLPDTELALVAEQLIGAVTLRLFQGPLADAGTPWLTNLWVHPDWRRRGLGQALCHRMCTKARELGASQLQLLTYDKAAYYQALGWQTVRRAPLAGQVCTVMVFEL